MRALLPLVLLGSLVGFGLASTSEPRLVLNRIGLQSAPAGAGVGGGAAEPLTEPERYAGYFRLNRSVLAPPPPCGA